jgi:hypothetical protein
MAPFGRRETRERFDSHLRATLLAEPQLSRFRIQRA